MEKLEFYSQVCTTMEQSIRLLKLGLKKDTADLVYYYSHSNGDWTTLVLEVEEKARSIEELEVPAWSLHRLIEISLSLTDAPLAYCYTAGSKMGVTYNEVIDMIEWAITKGYFNKDYIELKEVSI